MNEKILALFISVILVLAVILAVFIQKQDEKEETPIYVEQEIVYVDKTNTEEPWDGTQEHPYESIQEGITYTKTGGTLYVSQGTYYENFSLDKKISIIGEDRTNTIIDGEYTDIVVEINEDETTITGFTIRNSNGYKDNAGIKINSNRNIIEDCIVYRTKTGIYLDKTENNNIYNCLLHTNGEGVLFKSSSNCNIKDSELCHNSISINIKDSSNNEISNSYAHENGIAIFSYGSSNINFIDCAICDNNDNQGGFFIQKSSNFNIKNCNIHHNGVGINLDDSTNSKIENCNLFWNTHFAILLENNAEENEFTKCVITKNFRYGIDMYDSKCTVTDSNLFDNQIDSIHLKNSNCIARNNYWGGIKGPFFSGFRLIDRIKRESWGLKYLPWKIRSVSDAGADWHVTDVFEKTEISGYGDEPIKFSGEDTDEDGLPDWWEKKHGYNPNKWDDHINLDPDKDALNNFEECYTDQYGSDPHYKDVFLEFDWVKSSTGTNKPSKDLMDEMTKRFKEHDINIHVDLGKLDGGEEIPKMKDYFTFDALRDLYWDYFLHNNLNNPRKNIFHYGLVCDHGPGAGFAFIGWAHLNSFCISGLQLASGEHSKWSRETLIATGSMHETGHTLGLFADDHGGIDNRAAANPLYKEFWKYNNYKSTMNYRHTWDILDYSDGSHGRGDFDDWGNLDYDFFKNTHYTLLVPL
jgi:parallel beta-helix repeat protein